MPERATYRPIGLRTRGALRRGLRIILFGALAFFWMPIMTTWDDLTASPVLTVTAEKRTR